MGSSSLTRDQTWVPCTGSAESEPLGHPRSPEGSLYQQGNLGKHSQTVRLFLSDFFFLPKVLMGALRGAVFVRLCAHVVSVGEHMEGRRRMHPGSSVGSEVRTIHKNLRRMS